MKPGACKCKIAVILVLLQFHSADFTAQPFCHKINDTLADGKVITVTSQDEAFQWIGTTDGLVRISRKNGRQKMIGSSHSSNPFGFITSICCRKNGHVWIGTLNGIILYDGYYFFRMNTENTNLADNLINFIHEDKDEIVWVGTRDGLVKVHKNRFQLFKINVVEIMNQQNGNNLFITATNQKIESEDLK